jgi:hypothetical protein
MSSRGSPVDELAHAVSLDLSKGLGVPLEICLCYSNLCVVGKCGHVLLMCLLECIGCCLYSSPKRAPVHA